MKDRCANPNHDSYADYGGRGIRCHWSESFEPFLSYFTATFGLTEIPVGLSVDRVNNDGDYAPGNLRLADAVTQANNKRNNRWVEYRGERLTIPQLARRTGILTGTLRARIDVQGKTAEQAVAMGKPL